MILLAAEESFMAILCRFRVFLSPFGIKIWKSILSFERRKIPHLVFFLWQHWVLKAGMLFSVFSVKNLDDNCWC